MIYFSLGIRTILSDFLDQFTYIGNDISSNLTMKTYALWRAYIVTGMLSFILKSDLSSPKT